MKRGVSFQIPNEYGNVLWRILQPFEITHYMWKMRGETYFVTDGLDDQEFFKDNSVVEGAVLLKNQSVLYHFR